MTVKLLTEHHLEFSSLKGGCTGSSESTLINMSHCWKSYVTAHLCLFCYFDMNYIDTSGNLLYEKYMYCFFSKMYFNNKILIVNKMLFDNRHTTHLTVWSFSLPFVFYDDVRKLNHRFGFELLRLKKVYIYCYNICSYYFSFFISLL